MAQPSPRPTPRFHRRILVLGALATLLLLVIGGPIFVNRIEDDLELRVPVELAEAGYVGVTATFSGQDGTLRCEAPLDDPEQAIAAAYDVWGVRAIEIDRSCRVNRAPVVETTTTLAADESTTTVSVADGDDADATNPPVESTIPPDFDTLADVVAGTPQLSLLAVLIDEADLTEDVGDVTADPVTLFAPSDEAFDALDADALAQLRADPELLRRVLNHHAVEGSLVVDDLVDGTLESLDGGELEIVTTSTGVTVGGAAITTPDLMAINGIVHVIDQVVIPADVDPSGSVESTATRAVFENGTVVLSGVVGSEVERAALTAAVASAPGQLAVDDQLTVDPELGLDGATVAVLGQLVAALPAHLLNGTVGSDGTSSFVTGTYIDDAGRDSMLLIAESVGAQADLQPPPEATDIDAVALEAELNAYVAENPILFEPGSNVLTESSNPVLDRLALEARQFAGLAITVEGHTDTDGDPARNLVLSQARANVVRDALVIRGLPGDAVTAVGFGSEQPVVVDGAEDKTASRRVEFRVVSTS